MLPKLGRTKPETIQYTQFTGWASWLEMADWTKDVYFVPEGYEHPLRLDTEKDRSTGEVLAHAPCFLVMMDDEGDARVDVGFYIVRKSNGEFYYYSPHKFEEQFERGLTGSDQ